MRGFRRRRPRWELTADLEMPPWYPLAVGAPPAEFAGVVERSLLASELWDPRLEMSLARSRAEEVAGWAEALRDVAGLVDASVLRPSVSGPVEAVLTLSSSGWPVSASLEAFVAEQRGSPEHDLTEVGLPVGRALRVHQVRPGAAWWSASSVESVGHAFRDPDGGVVWHEVFWPGAGEHRWCDRADAVAHGLSFA